MANDPFLVLVLATGWQSFTSCVQDCYLGQWIRPSGEKQGETDPETFPPGSTRHWM